MATNRMQHETSRYLSIIPEVIELSSLGGFSRKLHVINAIWGMN